MLKFHYSESYLRKPCDCPFHKHAKKRTILMLPPAPHFSKGKYDKIGAPLLTIVHDIGTMVMLDMER